ncbi:hypothetical protein BGZ63DRAFT_420817 [Mariannaea sp. PMI_226]|nr:hypothetical protein BGZ63DRAFT_420817 [Mariannaea sp. PMI_226]
MIEISPVLCTSISCKLSLKEYSRTQSQQSTVDSTHQNNPTEAYTPTVAEALISGFDRIDLEPMDLDADRDGGVFFDDWDCSGDEQGKSPYIEKGGVPFFDDYDVSGDEQGESPCYEKGEVYYEKGEVTPLNSPTIKPASAVTNATQKCCEIPPLNHITLVDSEGKSHKFEPTSYEKEMTMIRVHDICLEASKVHIQDFRKNIEERLPIVTVGSPESESGESRIEYAAMMLYHRGEPTDLLMSNASMISALFWERGVALRLLLPDAEYAAHDAMRTLVISAEGVVDSLALSMQECDEENLTRAYENMFKNGERFLLTLDAEDALGDLTSLKTQRDR